MKIRNFEYFASRVARKFDTVIQRSLYNYNGVWFANGMYMDFDGEFLYISECSNGVPTTVMSCFVCCYNTQKDFFHDLDLLVSCNCIKRITKTETTEETTDTTAEETATTETARIAKGKTDNQAYNSMCYNCKKFLNGCRGEKNKIYSGCVYKEKMEVRNNG